MINNMNTINKSIDIDNNGTKLMVPDISFINNNNDCHSNNDNTNDNTRVHLQAKKKKKKKKKNKTETCISQSHK